MKVNHSNDPEPIGDILISVIRNIPEADLKDEPSILSDDARSRRGSEDEK